MNRQQIAVVGAGFSGLGVCYHLLSQGYSVTLFDKEGIGASGLLHPFPGEHARLSWKGREGMAATEDLLEISAKALGREVALREGILRLALTEKQRIAFQERADMHADVLWWGAEKCHRFTGGGTLLPGIFIQSGITVLTRDYLEGLTTACASLGGEVRLEKFTPEMRGAFDQVVWAIGGGIKGLPGAENLELRYNKGQVLECKKPSFLRGVRSSLIGKGYIALNQEDDRCIVGSTYERDYITEEPCPGDATDKIFSQVAQFIPGYGAFEVLGCRAKLRVTSRKGYQPLVGKLGEGVWVVTGMGSRGLLYHALMGEMLAKMILEEVCV